MAPPTASTVITFRKPGTQPPVFLAGSFSDPPWVPQEMNPAIDDSGEHFFSKTIEGGEGSEFQYKFRLGLGEWWALDENAPTAIDELGNRNNIGQLPNTSQGKPETETSTSVETQTKTTHKMETEEVKAPLKTLAGRMIPRSETSTPTFARTAAEVADSAAFLDKEDPEPYIPDEIAGRTGLRRLSTTPIPEVAKTAAEVADTAQLLDVEANGRYEGDGRMPDAEAGKLGVRRLSSTPIPEVAMTASEVADTARTLDSDAAYEARTSKFDVVDTTEEHRTETDRLAAPVGAWSADFEDFDTYVDDSAGPANERVPLFAHECAGIYDDAHNPDHSRSGSYAQEVDPFDADLDDPTLERFPSNRLEIMETVRKIESGLGTDQTMVEGVPPSPIVGTTHRGDYFTENGLSVSPLASPIAPQPSRRLRVPRASQGSISNISSAASLASIEEGEEQNENSKDATSPVVLHRSSQDEPEILASRILDSDEDEAVVMRQTKPKLSMKHQKRQLGYLTPERTASPQPSEPGSPSEPTPNTEIPIPVHEAGDAAAAESLERDATTTVVKENVELDSPSVVVHAAGPADKPSIPSGETSPAVVDGSESHSRAIPAAAPEHGSGSGGGEPSDDQNGATVSAVVGRDRPELTNKGMTQPTAEGATTTTSIQPTRNFENIGIWFRGFIRFLFVDTIGGFFRRLWGVWRQEGEARHE